MNDETHRKKHYFSAFELALWLGSLALIGVAFVLWDRVNFLTLCASLIGVTSLIFCAKGNPVGQALIIVFAVLYGVISWMQAYYGEVITPYKGNRAEVKINVLRGREYLLMFLLAAAVTVAFYFILQAFHTANLIPSTVSVTTSFIAVYLTARRSPFYALGYAANDIVLVVLWSLAAVNDLSALSVVICFAVFLVNDVYGFVSWQKMKLRQTQTG